MFVDAAIHHNQEKATISMNFAVVCMEIKFHIWGNIFSYILSNNNNNNNNEVQHTKAISDSRLYQRLILILSTIHISIFLIHSFISYNPLLNDETTKRQLMLKKKTFYSWAWAGILHRDDDDNKTKNENKEKKYNKYT